MTCMYMYIHVHAHVYTLAFFGSFPVSVSIRCRSLSCMYHVHVLMRDEKERSKQGQINNKANQHSTPKAVTFPKKNESPRVGVEPTTLYTLDRALYHVLYTVYTCKLFLMTTVYTCTVVQHVWATDLPTYPEQCLPLLCVHVYHVLPQLRPLTIYTTNQIL